MGFEEAGCVWGLIRIFMSWHTEACIVVRTYVGPINSI